MALLTGLSACSVIIAALAVSVTACIIAYIMICSVAILSWFSRDCLLWVCLFMTVCLIWDFFPFTSDSIWCYLHWRTIILLVASDYVIFSIYLTWLSGYICTREHLYTIAICTDGMSMDMCSCLLLVAICVLCYWLGIFHLWYESMWILCNYRYICFTVHVLLYHYTIGVDLSVVSELFFLLSVGLSAV